MWTASWWKDAVERAIRTFAQTFVAVVGVSSFSVWSLDWHETLGVSLGSALLALLMAVDRNTTQTASVQQFGCDR